MVSVGRMMSTSRDVSEGIPQGSVLSCSCFMIAINGTAQNLPQYVRSTLYVEDFCIYSSGTLPQVIERRMQMTLNQLTKYSHKTGCLSTTIKRIPCSFAESGDVREWFMHLS